MISAPSVEEIEYVAGSQIATSLANLSGKGMDPGNH